MICVALGAALQMGMAAYELAAAQAGESLWIASPGCWLPALAPGKTCLGKAGLCTL